MRRHSIILILFASFIWLALVFISHRIADDIADILRNDAVPVLGLPVEVEQVNVGLASGHAQITGLQISNYEGFPSSHVFDMADIQLNIGILSLLPAVLGWRPYYIEEILIDTPVVYVDVDRQGDSNLEQILRSIRESRPQTPAREVSKSGTEQSTSSTPPAEGEGKPAKTREPIRLRVGRLNIDNLNFHLKREGKAEQSGSLPAIHMQDIGGKEGITPHGLGLKVTGRLAGDILAVVLVNKATEKLEEKMNDSMQDMLKGLEKKLDK